MCKCESAIEFLEIYVAVKIGLNSKHFYKVYIVIQIDKSMV